MAAEAGLARRDGRCLGPLRGVAAAARGRHRDRRGHRLRSILDGRPGPDLSDGDGPVLPGAPRSRSPDLRRPAGPGGDRRRGSPTSARWPRSPCGPGARGRRRAAGRGVRPPAAPPPRRAADHRRRRGHGAGHRRPGPAAGRAAGLHHRVRPSDRVPQPVVPGPGRLAVHPHRRRGRRSRRRPGRGGRAPGRLHPRGAAAAERARPGGRRGGQPVRWGPAGQSDHGHRTVPGRATRPTTSSVAAAGPWPTRPPVRACNRTSSASWRVDHEHASRAPSSAWARPTTSPGGSTCPSAAWCARRCSGPSTMPT